MFPFDVVKRLRNAYQTIMQQHKSQNSDLRSLLSSAENIRSLQEMLISQQQKIINELGIISPKLRDPDPAAKISTDLTISVPAEGPFAPHSVILELRTDGRLGRKGDRLMAPIDQAMLPLILEQGSWQEEEIVFVTQRIGSGAGCTLVDVGANIGLFSRQMLEALPDLKDCICVEPDAKNFEALKFNLQHHCQLFKIKLYNIALGAETSQKILFRDRQNMGNYSLNPDAMRDRPFDKAFASVVSAADWTSDALASAGRIIWKSDTQGYDEAIVSAVPMEIWNRVEVAILELWRIEKPDFDRQAFRKRIETFPHRRIGQDLSVSANEIELYLSGRDYGYADLYLWR